MALPTYGTMAVDWENRVDFDRLRRERLARAKELLGKSEMGSLLCFDMNNVRYLTATHIGTWAQDKANRLPSFRKTTNRFCGTSDPQRSTTNCIVPGWASGRERVYRYCAAR